MRRCWRSRTGDGLASFRAAELQEMALLYRQVAADLSVLRQDATARTYADHVNQLLARAHHIIYSGTKTSCCTSVSFSARRISRNLPAANLRYVIASLLVSVAWGVLGAVLTNARPEFMRHFVGPADDCHHGAPRDVDEVDCQRRAHGFELHHDQQPHGQFRHVRQRHCFRAGNLLLSLSSTA